MGPFGPLSGAVRSQSAAVDCFSRTDADTHREEHATSVSVTAWCGKTGRALRAAGEHQWAFVHIWRGKDPPCVLAEAVTSRRLRPAPWLARPSPAPEAVPPPRRPPCAWRFLHAPTRRGYESCGDGTVMTGQPA